MNKKQITEQEIRTQFIMPAIETDIPPEYLSRLNL